jgi:hypothetical protein
MTSSHPLFLASSLPISSSSHDTTAAVYNLLHGVDLEATEAQIELYQTEHMQSIRERQSHIAEEERRIEMMIKHEQQAAALLAQELQEKDLLEKQKGQLLKKQTLEVMMGVRLSFSSSSLYSPLTHSGSGKRHNLFGSHWTGNQQQTSSQSIFSTDGFCSHRFRSNQWK